YDRLAELSDRIIAAAEYTGIGLTLLPVFYQYGGCDQQPLQGGQLRFKNDFDQYEKLFSQAKTSIQNSAMDYNIGIAPHSLRAASPSDIDALTKLSGDRPFHIHVAEQVAEVEEVQAALGGRPVEWLLNNTEVDARWCLIHCTQMKPHETVALAKSGAIAGLCPITESSLGDGIFDGVNYLAKGGAFGIGSDSNIHVSLFEELKTFEYSQRLRDRSRAALATSQKSTGRNLFDAALQGGADASQRTTGKIEVGNFADLIGVGVDNEWLAGRQNDELLNTMIFGGSGQRCLTDVWSAGRHVVQDGVHIRKDVIKRNFINVLVKLGQAL
ncbi:MAG: formimidoylglutamate deiminase, partial [Gammaproteobacteria bacterium]